MMPTALAAVALTIMQRGLIIRQFYEVEAVKLLFRAGGEFLVVVSQLKQQSK